MDRVSASTRSWNMAQVKGADTKLEIFVRKRLHRLGYRYRVHYPVKGKPDIAFPSQKVAVFIHGCFWHQHGCKKSKRPQANKKFWDEKLNANISRDKEVLQELEREGWTVLTCWECKIKESLNSEIERIAFAILKE